MKKSAFWPVGYPAFLSIFYRVFGPNVLIAKLLNVFFLASITVMTYLLARDIFSKKTAKRAAMIIALLPSQTFYAVMPMADIPFALLVSIILYLSIARQSVVNSLLLGGLFGCAMLVRPVIVFYPVILFFYRVAAAGNWKKAFVHAAIIVLVGEAVMLPWQVRNYSTFGGFVLVSTNGGINLWMGNNPHASGGFILVDTFMPKEVRAVWDDMNEREKDKYAVKQGVDYALKHPLQTLFVSAKKLVHLFYRDSKCVTLGAKRSYEKIPPFVLMGMIILAEGYYYVLMGCAALAGLFLLSRKDKPPSLYLLGATLIYFVFIHLPFITEGRYHIPLIPIFAILCAPSKCLAFLRLMAE